MTATRYRLAVPTDEELHRVLSQLVSCTKGAAFAASLGRPPSMHCVHLLSPASLVPDAPLLVTVSSDT